MIAHTPSRKDIYVLLGVLIYKINLTVPRAVPRLYLGIWCAIQPSALISAPTPINLYTKRKLTSSALF